MEIKTNKSRTPGIFSMSPQIDQLAAALAALNKACDPILKNAQVGDVGSRASYKGVSDGDVKAEIGANMAELGLSIVPVEYETDTTITFFTDKYGDQKKSIFSELHARYLLFHTSGQFMTVAGYGHGQDNGDKSAGKATTYALKYVLIYISLAETTLQTKDRKIDDADAQHSNDYEREWANEATKKPVQQQPKPAQSTAPVATPAELPLLNKTKYKSDELTPDWIKVIGWIKKGYTIADCETRYKMSSQTKKLLLEEQVELLKAGQIQPREAKQ